MKKTPFKKDEVQRAFEKRLANGDQFFQFLQFISKRERVRATSDIGQMSSYIREENFNLRRGDLMDIFIELTQLGLGNLRGYGSQGNDRVKFEWHYWLFPIFDKVEKPKQLLALELKPISIFETTPFKVVKAQVDRYRDNILAGFPDVSLKPDIVFISTPKAPKADLSQASLDELLAEIERRGWIAGLTKAELVSKGKKR